MVAASSPSSIAFAALFLAVFFVDRGFACKGCVSLDELSFDKIISRFKVVLVKFDVAYPYGDKHETFSKLAEEVSNSDDVLVAQVGIKDYGDKDNEDLGNKYGVTSKDDLPALRLFVRGRDSPIEFSSKSEWTVDNIRNLIRDNADVYLGLPGCLEKYDKLAMQFINAGDKKVQLEATEKAIDNEDDKTKSTASTYLRFMKKIVDQGVSFVKNEISRLKKIVNEGKLNDKKKEELSHRLNILHSFSIPLKEEL